MKITPVRIRSTIRMKQYPVTGDVPKNRMNLMFAHRANDNMLPGDLFMARDPAVILGEQIAAWQFTDKQMALYSMLPQRLMKHLVSLMREEQESLLPDLPVPAAHGVAAMLALTEVAVAIIKGLPDREAKFAHSYLESHILAEGYRLWCSREGAL